MFYIQDECNNEGRAASTSFNGGTGSFNMSPLFDVTPEGTVSSPVQSRPDDDQLFSASAPLSLPSASTTAEDPTALSSIMDCFECSMISNTECESKETIQGRQRFFNTFNSGNEDDLPAQSKQNLFQSLLGNSVRIDFNTMVSSMAPEDGICRCREGFIPFMSQTDEMLERCHDPIKKSATMNSRCLLEEHCSDMAYTTCRANAELAKGTGIKSYMTCQCRDGYVQEGEVCVEEQLPERDRPQEKGCIGASDCGNIENVECRLSIVDTSAPASRVRSRQLNLPDQFQEEFLLNEEFGEELKTTPTAATAGATTTITASGTSRWDDYNDGFPNVMMESYMYDADAAANLDEEEIIRNSDLLSNFNGFNTRQQQQAQQGPVLVWTGRCTCREGYIPIRAGINGPLTRCQDPIVLTSTVDGRCLTQAHCGVLPGLLNEHPTGPITILVLRLLSIEVSELHEVCQSTNFEASKFWKGRAGNFLAQKTRLHTAKLQ